MELPDLAAVAVGLPASILQVMGSYQVAAGPGIPLHITGLLYAAVLIYMVLSLREAPLVTPVGSRSKVPRQPRWTPPAIPAVFCGAVLAYGGILATGASSSLSGGAAVNGTTLVASCPVGDGSSGTSALSLIGPWPGVFVTPFLAVPLVGLAAFGVWAAYCSWHGRGCAGRNCGEVLRRRSAVALASAATGLGIYMSATLYHQMSQTSCHGPNLWAQITTVGICTMIGCTTIAAAANSNATSK